MSTIDTTTPPFTFKATRLQLPPGPWTCATCAAPVDDDAPCVVLTGGMEDRRHDDVEHVWCSQSCAWKQHPAHVAIVFGAALPTKCTPPGAQ